MLDCARRFSVVCSTASILALALLCGCGGSGRVLTKDLEGRVIGIYDVSHDWAVYSWHPPNDSARPVQLVARHLASGKSAKSKQIGMARASPSTASKSSTSPEPARTNPASSSTT
jgi:hypothetical protein